MDELKKLLQEHDKDIFTNELCEKISEIFETAKDKEIQTLTEEFEADNKTWKEEQTALYEAKYNELVEKVDAVIEEITEEIHESQLENYQDQVLVEEALEMHQIQKGMLEKYAIDYNKLGSITEDPSTHEENALKINNLTEGLNDKENELFNLKKKYREVCKVSIIGELSEGLSEMEKEKLEELCEALEYDENSPNEFIEKVIDIREIFSNVNTNEGENTTDSVNDVADTLNEDEEGDSPKSKMLKKSIGLL